MPISSFKSSSEYGSCIVSDISTNDIIVGFLDYFSRFKIDGTLIDTFEPPSTVLDFSIDTNKRKLYVLDGKGVTKYRY